MKGLVLSFMEYKLLDLSNQIIVAQKNNSKFEFSVYSGVFIVPFFCVCLKAKSRFLSFYFILILLSLLRPNSDFVVFLYINITML